MLSVLCDHVMLMRIYYSNSPLKSSWHLMMIDPKKKKYCVEWKIINENLHRRRDLLSSYSVRFLLTKNIYIKPL